MSTPMYEVPEHLPMPINRYGSGPESDPDEVVDTICWCGTNGCTLWR